MLNLFSCGSNKESDKQTESVVVIESESDNSEEIEVIPANLEELSTEYKSLIGVLQPSLAEYDYNFPKDWINISQQKEWDEIGFDSNLQGAISRLSFFTFDGVKVGEYRDNATSPFYETELKPQAKDKNFDQSVRLNIFRYPKNGLPLLAINGKVLNANHYRMTVDGRNRQLLISARVDRSSPFINFNDSTSEVPEYDPYKMVTSTSQAFNWDNHNNEAYRDVDDPLAYLAESDPEKYLFVNITMHGVDQEAPMIDLKVDGEEFALIKNTWENEVLSPEEIMTVKKHLFDKTFGQTIYEYNTGVGTPVAAPYVDKYIEMHNSGKSGYHEAGRNEFKFGRDVKINDEKWGRVYRIAQNNDNIELYVFRYGEADKPEKIILPKSSQSNKIKLTFNGKSEELEEIK